MSLHDLLLEYRKAKKDLITLSNKTVDKEDRSLIFGYEQSIASEQR